MHNSNNNNYRYVQLISDNACKGTSTTNWIPYKTYGKIENIHFSSQGRKSLHIIIYTQCMHGLGSNHMLWGPLVQVMGVALITEFCDHMQLFFCRGCISMTFMKKVGYNDIISMMKIGRIHTQGLCIYQVWLWWGEEEPPWFLLHWYTLREFKECQFHIQYF